MLLSYASMPLREYTKEPHKTNKDADSLPGSAQVRTLIHCIGATECSSMLCMAGPAERSHAKEPALPPSDACTGSGRHALVMTYIRKYNH